ncbi:MAG TPA: lipopolysaccharide kinase InaA family protein [Planctomycetaceae bacterium]|jgi:tRNA A-37 threonylcarbamoyl transferase component Bud32|nr:lipopolysaccharide kinase InaA family protein [Planctomycetaceae bacterium]
MPQALPTYSAPQTELAHRAATSVSHRRIAGSDFTAIAVGEIESDKLAHVLERPSRISDDPQATLIKRGRSAIVVRVDLPTGATERRVAYKRCGSRTLLRRLVRGVRTSAALRNFRLGHKLLALGVATPRPVLAVSPRWHNLLSPSFLATEWIEGGLPLDAFVRASMAETPDHRRAQLCDAARRLGQLIGTLHRHGFSHRDLKSANLLVRENGRQVEVFLIDLDGATVSRLRIETTRLKNLSRLHAATCRMSGVTATLRCQFLRSYLATLGNSANWKTVWRELQKASRIPPLRTG